MKWLLATVVWVLGVVGALAQTQSVLPNGMTQFSDGNGAPYAGGRVYMYIPHTTTPKVTYQDPNGTSPNQNPITLDANGRAVIWGSGLYRQVLQDANGVTVWDQPTVGLAAGGGSTIGTAGVNQYLITAAPYGALCDGATDDTAAIQAALDAAGTAGGGEVLVPVSANGCLVDGTLLMTKSNVTLRGTVLNTMSGGGSPTLLFQNGSADDINIGFQAGQINTNAVRDLHLANSGKTGGAVVSVQFTSYTTLENLWVDNAFNGVWFNRVNNAALLRSNLNCIVNGNSWCLQYNTTNGSASVRSDVVTIVDVALQLGNASGAGFIIDGFSNDVHADHLAILGAGSYGLWIRNSASSTSYFPAYGLFTDLEIDGENFTAVEIDAGDNWQFVQSVFDSIRATNTSVPIFEVTPDIGGSYTRQVYIIDSYIATGPGKCLVFDARDSLIVGSTLADCGKYAGANGLGGAQPPVPVMEIGGDTNGLNVTGNVIGYVFGQCCSGSNNYAVQVDAGAQAVILGSNNMRLFNGTTTDTINNLAGGDKVAVTAGGFGYSGAPMSPYVEYGGSGGVNDFRTLNNGTSGSSCSRDTIATGTANSFASWALCDGGTPASTLSTGAGVTGGLTLATGAGELKLGPSNGVVQFTNGGSFIANGGGATGVTSVGPGNASGPPSKWLRIRDNGGGIYVIPVWLCSSGC